MPAGMRAMHTLAKLPNRMPRTDASAYAHGTSAATSRLTAGAYAMTSLALRLEVRAFLCGGSAWAAGCGQASGDARAEGESPLLREKAPAGPPDLAKAGAAPDVLLDAVRRPHRETT